MMGEKEEGGLDFLLPQQICSLNSNSQLSLHFQLVVK
jgi:hypothetical protein